MLVFMSQDQVSPKTRFCLSVFLLYLNPLTDIDECVTHRCAYGGSCVDGVNNYSCSCTAGFTGDRCGTGRLQSTLVVILVIHVIL